MADQPVRVGPASEYGQATRLENAQRAVPLPNNRTQPPPQRQGPPNPVLNPGGGGLFGRPSERAEEPVMTPPRGSPPGEGPLADRTAAQMREYLPVLEMGAMNPTLTDATRRALGFMYRAAKAAEDV